MEEAINLEDLDTLRLLASGSSSPEIFISELQRNGDSDIEDEEIEFVPNRSRYVQPALRTPQEINEAEDEPEIPAANGTVWREGAVTPDELEFTGTSGLQREMDDTTPLDYLKLMIDDEMVANIVTETNRYADQTLSNRQLSPKSRFRQWTAVTVPEMWAFLGLIIGMGLIVIENLEEYWSIDELYKLPFFGSVMVKDRFCLILSFLHLSNNQEQPARDNPAYDPVFKIRPFVDSLVNNFKSTFHPGKNVAIDEAMVAWRGPLSFRVYNPDKPDKFGMKVFELCDSASAYCSNLEFYTGKKEVSSHGATFDVVNRLIQPYLGCGRTLYVDNYYTSPDLFTHLKDNATLACGTMRANRKNGPPKELVPKLKKGDATVIRLTNGSLNYIKFMDKKEVRILTTAHAANLVQTGKTNPVTKEAIVKFEAVHQYNQLMGAVDRSDQMVSYNAFKRRTLKWWKKAFFHLFMLGVLNAYIVHKATAAKKLSHRVFRRDLAKQLVQLVPITPSLRPPLAVGQSSLFRLTARHFAKKIEPKPGAKKQNPQRECVVCSEPAKRKFSRFECRCCDVGLHIDPCFEVYHTVKDFKRAYKRKHQDD